MTLNGRTRSRRGKAALNTSSGDEPRLGKRRGTMGDNAPTREATFSGCATAPAINSVAAAGVPDLGRWVDAADDAWIACVVVLEKLQDSMLTEGQVTTLLAELAARYGRFRRALHVIECLVAHATAAP